MNPYLIVIYSLPIYIVVTLYLTIYFIQNIHSNM
jgi:hypothetical protein